MANIGATTAFYKVETSLTRANSEVSKSMERLATGKQNANSGDRSSYVAMADTFRLDYVGTKAGIKGASVVMGFLETGMRTLDAASALLSRMQELAVLGANDTNTDADNASIDAEAEALGDEFHRLLSKAKYKGKDLFGTVNDEYVSIGGRDAEMKFGIGTISYAELHDGTSLVHKPSDVFTADFQATNPLLKNTTYEIVSLDHDGAGTGNGAEVAGSGDGALIIAGSDLTSGTFAVGTKFTTGNADVALTNNRNMTLRFGKNLVTQDIEAVQKKINSARVEAGSQYAALESAVAYTTDLTAQYELGFNVVNDVNFSMETAHLAKNQILQQAATAMLAQANSGQQGLLQLIQG
jgi:flagellin